MKHKKILSLNQRLEILEYVYNKLIGLVNKCYSGKVEIHFVKGQAMNQTQYEEEKHFDLKRKEDINYE